MNGYRAVSWTQALAELGVVLRLDPKEAEAMLDVSCEGEPTRCRRCAGEKLYTLSGGRLRCAKCRYSFYRFTGRWLGRHRLPAKVWLAAIKAFELGLGPAEVAQVCELSLPTAAELEKTIQMSLASGDAEWVDAVKACDTGIGIPTRFAAAPKGNAFRVVPQGASETEEPAGDSSLPACRDAIASRPAGDSSLPACRDAIASRPVVDMPEDSPESMRAFRAGVRRWAKMPAGRFALKLKEWEIRATHQGSIFELALQALARYTPPGVSERKGGVTSVLHPGAERLESPLGHHPKHHHQRGAAKAKTGLVIRRVRLSELVPA